MTHVLVEVVALLSAILFQRHCPMYKNDTHVCIIVHRTIARSAARRYMLTRTQIEAARTTELERLADRIEAELSRRREQEELEDAGRKVLESLDTPRGTYQWEMVRCGHPERCRKCQGGEKHGPYLYRYFYKDGRRTSEYIKLTDAQRLGFSRPTTK